MLFFSFLFYIILDVGSAGGESACSTFLKCGDCISYVFDNCVWCSANEHDGKRCQFKLDVDSKWCKEPIYDPQSHFEITKNDQFVSSEDATSTVQLRPQNVRITLRPGAPATFPLSYKPAKDFPLDIYYLIDSSFTMKEHKEKLREQGIIIYKELTKLNNNVRLGMGSFIEKPGLPFSRDYTYAFKNNLKLTTDMNQFTKAVSNIEILGNFDDPESSLDALMQAMVCKEELGWREEARRIIVLSTDGQYHSAGDGKLTGAYRPNDMKCHLERDTYSSREYDYPSVGQINKVAMENNFKIIFAIMVHKIHHYKPLEQKIHGVTVVALNASDVVQMIIKEYDALVRNVLLESDLPPHVRLTAVPDCTERNNKLCNINHENSLDMNISLVTDKCMNKKGEQLKIGINSLKQKLIVDIEMDCVCECEKKGIENSTMCNVAGTYQCGVCACNENRYGSTCQCSGTDKTQQNYKDKCTFKNDTVTCSDRGTCRCGKCEDCGAGYSGEWCEFDDNSCARPGGRLCSGHGQCRFARCQCDAGWNTTDCRCPDHDRGCTTPLSKEICSGNGVCVCGQCECAKNENGCSGRFCEKCNKENTKICKELEVYALCVRIDDQCDKKYSQFNTFEIIKTNRSEFDSITKYVHAQRCDKTLKNGTTLVFKIDLHVEPPVLIVQNELDPPSVANIWIAVGSAIGLVVFIGLLTVIIWKYLIDLHDAKEYEKFESEAKAGGYNTSQNPLYTSPVFNVQNPAFDSKDCD